MISARRGAGTRRHFTNARLAASTAASTSALADFWKIPTTSRVSAGLRFSKVSPVLDSGAEAAAREAVGSSATPSRYGPLSILRHVRKASERPKSTESLPTTDDRRLSYNRKQRTIRRPTAVPPRDLSNLRCDVSGHRSDLGCNNLCVTEGFSRLSRVGCDRAANQEFKLRGRRSLTAASS